MTIEQRKEYWAKQELMRACESPEAHKTTAEEWKEWIQLKEEWQFPSMTHLERTHFLVTVTHTVVDPCQAAKAVLRILEGDWAYCQVEWGKQGTNRHIHCLVQTTLERWNKQHREELMTELFRRDSKQSRKNCNISKRKKMENTESLMGAFRYTMKGCLPSTCTERDLLEIMPKLETGWTASSEMYARDVSRMLRVTWSFDWDRQMDAREMTVFHLNKLLL